MVRESRLAAESKNLSIELHGEPVEAIADQLRVRQVLGNLVSNAVKFTSRGGVVVTVGKSDDHATLSVTDTGPGIAKEEQTAVFEEYRQSGDWQSRGAGSGLGLAITRRLVRMHGGRIELESRLGEGSRFTRAPAAGGSARQRAAPQQPDMPRGNTLRLVDRAGAQHRAMTHEHDSFDHQATRWPRRARGCHRRISAQPRGGAARFRICAAWWWLPSSASRWRSRRCSRCCPACCCCSTASSASAPRSTCSCSRWSPGSSPAARGYMDMRRLDFLLRALSEDSDIVDARDVSALGKQAGRALRAVAGPAPDLAHRSSRRRCGPR